MYKPNLYPGLPSPNTEPIDAVNPPKYPDSWYPNIDHKDKSVPYWAGLYAQKGPPPLRNNKTSPLTTPPQTNSSLKLPPHSSYWRNNFLLAFLPFLVCGCPIHLLFRSKRISSTREWLFSLCPCSGSCFSALFLSLLTLVTAAISIALNAYTFFIIGHFFYILVIKGDAGNDLLFPYLITIIRLLPVIIPLDLVWVKGHVIQRLILSLDRVADNYRRSPMNGEPLLPKVPSCRFKLLFLYVVIGGIHALHVLTDDGTSLSSNLGELLALPVDSTIFRVVADYLIAVAMTLVFPLYCVFAWAVLYQLQTLSGYISILIQGRHSPKYDHFDEFKKCYRQLADHIMCINGMFSIFLSVLIVTLGTFIYSDATNLGSKILELFVPGGSSGGFGGALKGIIDSITNPPTEAPPGVVVPTSGPEPLSPYKVRLLLGNIFIIFLYLVLFGLTYWQAVTVNDAVRYLHVWLNDFVTEPESRLNSELYEAFRLLKFYIHSRLEQQKPAFLGILILNFVPGLRNRLSLYAVYH